MPEPPLRGLVPSVLLPIGGFLCRIRIPGSVDVLMAEEPRDELCATLATNSAARWTTSVCSSNPPGL
jgi:hypothetical protein